MKTVIFDLVRDGALLVYPDDEALFSDTDVTSVPGKVIAQYAGELELDVYTPEPPTDPRPLLTVTGMTGAEYQTADLSYFEATEGAEVVFTGTIAIPDSDRPFTMPIIRRDTGRTIFARASVTGGVLTAAVRFPMSGLWETNAELVNQYREPGEHLRFNGIRGVVVV